LNEVLFSEMLPMVGNADTLARVKSKIMKSLSETRHKCILNIVVQFDKALLDGAPSSITVSGFLQSSSCITKNTLEKMCPMEWTRVEKGLSIGSNHDKDIERKGSWETIVIGEYGRVGHSKKVTCKHKNALRIDSILHVCRLVARMIPGSSLLFYAELNMYI